MGDFAARPRGVRLLPAAATRPAAPAADPGPGRAGGGTGPPGGDGDGAGRAQGRRGHGHLGVDEGPRRRGHALRRRSRPGGLARERAGRGRRSHGDRVRCPAARAGPARPRPRASRLRHPVSTGTRSAASIDRCLAHGARARRHRPARRDLRIHGRRLHAGRRSGIGRCADSLDDGGAWRAQRRDHRSRRSQELLRLLRVPGLRLRGELHGRDPDLHVHAGRRRQHDRRQVGHPRAERAPRTAAALQPHRRRRGEGERGRPRRPRHRQHGLGRAAAAPQDRGHAGQPRQPVPGEGAPHRSPGGARRANARSVSGGHG